MFKRVWDYKKFGNHWSSMSLYHWFPFTGTKGSSPNHEKQPQTIIPPPPNFTVGIMCSPGILQTQICLSDCQMVKHDSSLQRKCFHCSRVQWRLALRHSSQRLALSMVILALCTAAQQWKPISWSSRRTVLVLMLLPVVVWNSVVSVATEDRRFLRATH
jgi:hypothetical protein